MSIFQTDSSKTHIDTSDIYINDNGIINVKETNYKLGTIRNILENNDYFQKNDFAIEISDAIRNSYFENGYLNRTDEVFNKYHNQFGVIAVDWLSELFITNISDSKFALGVVRILSRQDYSEIGAQGKLILISSITQFKNETSILEAVIRVIENWEIPELIDILNSINSWDNWLNEYKMSVIEDLKAQCHTL